jgi:hypothetical protein
MAEIFVMEYHNILYSTMKLVSEGTDISCTTFFIVEKFQYSASGSQLGERILRSDLVLCDCARC